MVVTRRVPVPPGPPASRTASTQNVLRVSRTKPHASQQSADTTSNNAKSLKQKISPQKARGSKPFRSRIPSFSWLVLIIFSLYALSTLYPDPAQSFYKAVSIPYDTVIQPYLLPPLRTTLSHPVIDPHVTTVRTTLQPYAQRIDTTTRPILTKLSHVEEHRLRPLVRRGTKAVFHVIQTAWSGLVVPNYRIHLRPRVQPYLDRWSFFYYHQVEPPLHAITVKSYLLYDNVKPRVTKTLINLQHYSTSVYTKTRRYISHSYDAIRPRVLAFWVKIQPHLKSSYKFLRLQLVKGLSILRVYTASATTRLGDARREFVDPHLKRIWDKLENRSVAPSIVLETLVASADSTTLATAAHVSSIVDLSWPPSPTSVAPTSPGEEPLESVASIISDSIGLGVAAETISNNEVEQTLIVVPASAITTPVSEAAPTKTAESLGRTVVRPPDPVVSPLAEEESIDDFLQELGISADEPREGRQPTVANSGEDTMQHIFSARQEDDASAATLRAKVAAKRASIIKRHNDWQARMSDLFEARERDLRTTLVSLRKRAVEELRGLTLRDGQEGKEDEKVANSIEQEAGRLAKGVEGYLKKERDRREKLGREWYEQLEEKKSQWDTVLNKVDAKFAEKVKGAQEGVRDWYVGIRQKESEEVVKASSELKSLAETAQADLGLDYAWLEDVTYEDWQRYHDLMRTAEQFEDMARAIQNGTHAHTPVDPLTPALELLEQDVQGVIDGFQARFSLLRSEGNSLYTKEEVETPGSSSSSSTSPEPIVSILPISSGARGDVVDASNIILTKDEEQIKQALGAAGYAVDEPHDHSRYSHHDL